MVARRARHRIALACIRLGSWYRWRIMIPARVLWGLRDNRKAFRRALSREIRTLLGKGR